MSQIDSSSNAPIDPSSNQRKTEETISLHGNVTQAKPAETLTQASDTTGATTAPAIGKTDGSKPVLQSPEVSLRGQEMIDDMKEVIATLESSQTEEQFNLAVGTLNQNYFGHEKLKTNLEGTHSLLKLQEESFSEKNLVGLTGAETTAEIQQMVSESKALIANIAAYISALITELDRDHKKGETEQMVAERTDMIKRADAQIGEMLEAADKRHKAAVANGVSQIVASSITWIPIVGSIGNISTGVGGIVAGSHEKGAGQADAAAKEHETTSKVAESSRDVAGKQKEAYAQIRDALIDELKKLLENMQQALAGKISNI